MATSAGIPGVGLVFSASARTLRAVGGVAQWSERQVLGLLDARLDAVVRPTPVAALPGSTPRTDGLNVKLGRLLRQAIDQSTAAGQQELFHKIIDQLVPDEARIIGALSEGANSPMVNVYRRNRAGLVGEVVLENMSLIGKTANLALPTQTPTYVSHLLTLGLLEIGPEDPDLKVEYEVLSADMAVLAAVKEAGSKPIPARVERHTIRLSGLGLALWAAAADMEGEA